MTHSEITAGVHGQKGGRLEPFVVSALFDTPEAVDNAMARLTVAGVPRDLVEVVVSREAAERFYRGVARPPGREVMRYAGIGGLTGLLLSAALALGIVAWPGWEPPRATAIVQLLGPNVGAVGGAVLGALFGAFRRARPARRYERAAEAASAILVLVRTRTEDQVPVLRGLLAGSGGRDVRVEH